MKYELVENYRSKRNLVEFANSFVTCIPHRLKGTPIVPIQADDGRLKLVRYHSQNLISPLVQDILATPLFGTTCVLTKTNDEALQVTGLLVKSGMPARLIQSNDSVNLYNLAEVRFFLKQLALRDDMFVIDDEVWVSAKRALRDSYRYSTKLSICENMLSDFEASNPTKKYKSDLETFIMESKMEDFIGGSGEIIFVSTIHKAKGKEFDNVYLLLEDFNLSTIESRRLLYVAMTRAKQNLVIHSNSVSFDRASSVGADWITDTEIYHPLDSVAMHLTYRDVHLDYFIGRESIVSRAVSGAPLQINSDGGLSLNGCPIIRFS